MGDKNVQRKHNESELRSFTRAVLTDLRALEEMLKCGQIESDTRRIGAEQEIFLVDSAFHPAPKSVEVIEKANDKRLSLEIGRFNLEANLTPLELRGDCLNKMEEELLEIFQASREAAAAFDSGVVLAGILPTIHRSDLTLKNLTPSPRYEEINRVVSELHGRDRHIQIKGIDELQMTVQDTSIEFCNTSFQVHLQVGGDAIADVYNWAQAAAAPILAAAVNSPVLLDTRLWHETRIALFQHAIDTRSRIHRLRQQTPRVNFGDGWIEGSIIDALRDDVARFHILLTQAVREDSMEILAAGGIPELYAWRLHNGTIWRWNRICYGLTDGKPGLRVEARFLPAGPSIADEVANAAFFVGLMTSLPKEFGDVRRSMRFEIAKDNFFNAARYGLRSQIVWVDGRSYKARRLILEKLLPLARHGLEENGIDQRDIDKFLGIIEARAESEQTGAQWMLDSIASMDPRAKKNVRMRSITAAMKRYQEENLPVHRWELAEIPAESHWIDNYKLVEQFMTTDLFTVTPEDSVELVTNLMNWKHVRHVPVEDNRGKLVGIVSHRDLLEFFASERFDPAIQTPVRDIMKTELSAISPETPTLDALYLMRDKNIGCLPVVNSKKLVGLITAYDFLTVSAKLLEERLLNLEYEPSQILQSEVVTCDQSQNGEDSVNDLIDPDDLGTDDSSKSRHAKSGASE
jgi:CBS domain-containing protein/gamma-glutamyl:cysteine ligase YbdK (ATP-grasp superfamily)